MKINQENNGKVIGGLFTLGSLLLTLTFMVPMMSMALGLLIEGFMLDVLGDRPRSTVGTATLVTLLIILILSLGVILWLAKKKKLQTGHLVLVMIVEFFIVHPLGFYIQMANSGFRIDGQTVLGILFSFPVSSFGFVIIGMLIDSVKEKSLPDS